MKRLSFALLALQLLSLNAYASFGDPPKESLDSKCYRYDDKVIYAEAHHNGGPPTAAVGLAKITPKSSFKEGCEKAKKNLVLKDIDNGEFYGVVGSLVFIETYMRAPGSGGLRVFNLDDGKLKGLIESGDEPVELKGDTVVFWKSREDAVLVPSDSEEAWKKMGCPREWADSGIPCQQMVKTIFDLKTFKQTETSEVRIRQTF